MTVVEAARVLEVSPATVYDLCSAGRLAHRRIGLGRGVIRIDPAHLAAYLASCEVSAGGGGEPSPAPTATPKPVRRTRPDYFDRREAAKRRGQVKPT